MFEGGAEALFFRDSTLRGASLRPRRRQFVRARLELREELFDVARAASAQPLLHLFRQGTGAFRRIASSSSSERQRLRFLRIGRERSLALFGFDPARGDRHDLFVKAFGALAVQREPTEQHDAPHGIARVREACAREVVIDEALRAEAREETLRDALLEMQVDGLLGQELGVLERDRAESARRGANRRWTDPVSSRARSESRVELSSSRLSRQGGRAIRTSRPGSARSPASCAAVSAPSSSREHDSVSRNASASKPVHSRERSSRVAAALDLLLQFVLAFARRLEFLRGDALLSASRSSASISLRQAFGVLVADALPRRRSMSSSMTFARLPSSFLMVSVLRRAPRERGPPPLRQHEVVAAHFGAGCSLRSMRPLRCSMRPGFHGRSKWKRSAQCAWKFRPSRAASVASRMRRGSFAGGC
jgi:hypothetical protein